MKPFIDTAKAHGVARFVLLSAIREDETTPGTGKVHAYLKGLGVEWAVLRPTWFMENFSEQQHLPTIRDESSIYSTAGDGKISFVSAEDIAAVAHRALVDAKPHNRDYVIVGPGLLSHDDAAALFTEILGRQVRQVRRSEDQVVEAFVKFGLPESYARRLSGGELRASRGEFAILNNEVAGVTGRPPLTLRQYIEKHKQIWQS
ncbi:MAG: hypothetical protein M1822_008085 [Bathelium mastoideum]|nr:MAG: hypothetical protein M1822_008085 [Bathelium mastoideum]